MNRSNARVPIFERQADYEAFERVLDEAQSQVRMRVLAYCIMPNHWHLVLWPEQDHDLSRFVAWLTLTHVQRWHAHRQSAGLGHLYQGRFRSFPVENDEYCLTVCRYVERNALRAGLVDRAEDWRWSSLWRFARGPSAMPDWLAAWPLDRPANWPEWVNSPQTAAELESIRCSVRRGRPYGSESWVQKIAGNLELHGTLRPRGRPSVRQIDSGIKKVPDTFSGAGKGS